MAKEKKQPPTVAERKDEAIRVIGRDGVVIVRPTGEVEAIDLKLGRKKVKASKGSNRKPPPKRASDLMVDGYRESERLSIERYELVRLADDLQAKPWLSLAQYCERMANTRALDDDQYQATQVGARNRNEVPMDVEQMEQAEEAGKLLAVMDAIGQRPLDDEEAKWKRVAVELALGYLSPQQRECFDMFYGGGLTYAQIAQHKGISEKDVHKHLSRARTKLKNDVRPSLESVFGQRRWLGPFKRME